MSRILLNSIQIFNVIFEKICLKNNIVLHILMLIFIFFYGRPCGAQTHDVKSPVLFPVKSLNAGVNAASLGMFIDDHNDFFTGKINISIPIYEFKIADHNFPINLSYQTGGFHVNQIASWVGLGWNLNCGGMISREVRGIPDEIFDIGYLSTSGTLLQEDLMDGEIDDIYDTPDEYNTLMDIASGHRDGAPDIYTFNVGGETGKFIFSPGGEIRWIGEHFNKYKITWTREALPGNPASYLSIKEFIITDESGIKYYFGNEYIDKLVNNFYYIYEEREDSYKALAENAYLTNKYTGGINGTAWDDPDNFYYTSWYLKKIKFPDNPNDIDFYYTSETNFTYSSTSETKYAGKRRTPTSLDNIDLDHPFCIRRNNNYQELISQRINKITCNGITMEFLPEEALREDINDPPSPHGEAKALKEIKVYDNNGNQKIWSFQHTYFESAPLSPEALNYPSFMKRLRLDGVICGDEDWSFEYYSESSLPSRNTSEIDFWGYYKHQDSQHNRISTPTIYAYPGDYANSTYKSIYSIYPRINPVGVEHILPGIDRTPNLNDTKAFTLKKITYPTKGYKLLEYEQNRFMWDGVERIGPGLRIAEITSHFGEDQLDIVKTYAYVDENGNCSGKITNLPDFAYLNIDAVNIGNQYQNLAYFDTEAKKMDAKTTRLNFSFCSLGSVNGGYVGYTKVIESIANGGSTEYTFEFDDPSAYTNYGFPARIENGWDDAASMPGYFHTNFNYVDNYPYFSPPDFNWGIGQLKSKISKNSNQLPVEVQTFEYDLIHNEVELIPSVQAGLYDQGHALWEVWDNGEVIFSHDLYWSDIIWGISYQSSDYKRLNNSTTKTFDVDGNNPIVTTTNYYYDNPNYKFSTRIEKNNSKGELIKQRNYYPSDYSTSNVPLFNLTFNHILNKPVDIREYVGDKLTKGSQFKYNTRGQVTDYYNFESSENDVVFSPTDPYTFAHKKTTTYYAGSLVPKELLNDDDIKLSYIWGYNMTYPIAEVKNAGCTETSNSYELKNLQFFIIPGQEEGIIFSGNDINNVVENSLASVTLTTYQNSSDEETHPIDFILKRDGGSGVYDEIKFFGSNQTGYFIPLNAGSYILSYRKKSSYMAAGSFTYTRHINNTAVPFEFGYTGFENNETNSFPIPNYANASFVTDAFTGEKALHVSSTFGPGTTFEVGDKAQNHSGYKASCWVKGSTDAYLHIEVDGVSSTFTRATNTANNTTWHLLEVELPRAKLEPYIASNLKIKVYVGGSGIFDDIRFYPMDAQMTTYTYEPLFGVSSISDINSKPTTYEYDGFGRLILVRDFLGDILKKYNYNYK